MLECANDHAALCIVFIGREAVLHRFQGLAGNQRDTVVAFLAEIVGVVAHVPYCLLREFRVVDLGFLQADQGRLILVDDRLELVQTGPNTVDIE